jgi:hypothetical protein
MIFLKNIAHKFIYSLFIEAVSKSACLAANCSMVNDKEMERI